MRSAIDSRSRSFGLPQLALALLFVAGTATASCNETPLPGTVLGIYKVTGQSAVNSCGADLGAPDPWVFNAQISKDGETVYWSWLDGSAPLSGPLTTTTKASITTSQTANVDSSDAGLGPCTLARADDIELTLGTGSPPSLFTGTVTYSFTVPSGSTCSDQLTSAGGMYSALPCTISYTVTAAHQ